MKRLTKKNSKGFYEPKLSRKPGMTETLNGLGACVQKLGELEDIEEELGIDLPTLFKAIKFPIYVKEEGITYWCSNRLMSVLTAYYAIVIGKDTFLKTKDYGKTWALTKEELE